VGSVVGFFQDVVGAGNHSDPSSSINHPSINSTSHHHHHHHHQPCEIKEQIEWLHFEPVSMLISSGQANNSPFVNANILLVLGYKTGFAIWTIDVSILMHDSD
jgi:hypothetical protein